MSPKIIWKEFCRGWGAREYNHEIKNPHPVGSWEFDSWQAGWEEYEPYENRNAGRNDRNMQLRETGNDAAPKIAFKEPTLAVEADLPEMLQGVS